MKTIKFKMLLPIPLAHITRLSFLSILVLTFGALQKEAGAQTATYKFIDAGVAAGGSEGSLAFSYSVEKALGKKKKIVIGIGGRFTSYLGHNQNYLTAPAKLTSGSTGPLVIFKANIEENMDTFLIKTSQVNLINVVLTVGYNLSERLMLRFNIDAIGVAFGQGVNGTYISGSQRLMESARPTSFNLLLISDNDKGSLNSELFARYRLNDRLGIKGGIQFLFTEFTTDSAVQAFPESSDRFRRKSLMVGAGVSFNL